MIRLSALLSLARRTVFVAAFTLAMAAVALGSAGIVAMWAHPPGTTARAELTWDEDRSLGTLLNSAQADLEAVAADTDRLATLARGALAGLTADEQGPVEAALTEGSGLAASIDGAASALRLELSSLPGGQPGDATRFSLDVLSRRSGLLAALDATSGLGRSWSTLTSRALQASRLIGSLTGHDATVASAAAKGRAADYEGALATLKDALARLDAADAIRNRLANTSDVSTLDEWIARNRAYDTALQGLYSALRDSGGAVTAAVRSAYLEEGRARAALPPDTRGLVVIMADVGRGGLNQAVIAIDEARTRLTLALQAVATLRGAAASS